LIAARDLESELIRSPKIQFRAGAAILWRHRKQQRKGIMDTALLSPQRSQTIVELVHSAQAGDRDAFGELFDRYRSAVLAIAIRRTGNIDEAEELCQDVFVQAMQKIDQLRVPEAFGGWVRQIVHRMAINRITRKPRAVACDPVVMQATCLDTDDPASRVVDRENAAMVHEGLGRLGAMDRETLEAFYIEGQTLIEMSDAFDAPIGTIKRRLHVARKRLAKELDVLQAV